jgi:hypothetical protein
VLTLKAFLTAKNVFKFKVVDKVKKLNKVNDVVNVKNVKNE